MRVPDGPSDTGAARDGQGRAEAIPGDTTGMADLHIEIRTRASALQPMLDRILAAARDPGLLADSTVADNPPPTGRDGETAVSQGVRIRCSLTPVSEAALPTMATSTRGEATASLADVAFGQESPGDPPGPALGIPRAEPAVFLPDDLDPLDLFRPERAATATEADADATSEDQRAVFFDPPAGRAVTGFRPGAVGAIRTPDPRDLVRRRRRWREPIGDAVVRPAKSASTATWQAWGRATGFVRRQGLGILATGRRSSSRACAWLWSRAQAHARDPLSRVNVGVGLLLVLAASMGGFRVFRDSPGVGAESRSPAASASNAAAPSRTNAYLPQASKDTSRSARQAGPALHASTTVTATPTSSVATRPAGRDRSAGTRGQLSASRSVQVSAGPSARRGANRSPVVYVSTLEVHSTPEGAAVFLNNRSVGITPLRLAEVPVGTYAVRLELTAFERWSRAVMVATGRRARVEAQLVKAPTSGQ